MFSPLIKWKIFLNFDAGVNEAKGTENFECSLKKKLTSQLCRGNRFSNHSYDPKVQTRMC